MTTTFQKLKPKSHVRDALDFLVQEAVWAPSGDNIQPWRFEIDPAAGALTISVDRERDDSIMNAGQRMSRIAVGAAAETVIWTAEHNRWSVEARPAGDGSEVRITITDIDSRDPQPAPLVHQRVTNRRLYEKRLLPPELLKALTEDTPPIAGVSTQWITREETLVQLSEVIAKADELMLGNRRFRDAFLANVRFKCEPKEQVNEGLSVGSLEVSEREMRAFRMLPKLPGWLLDTLRVGKKFANNTRQLVRSATGLCLGAAAGDAPVTDLWAGRAMQRAWLVLTKHGFAVQPMMSVCGLQNVIEFENDAPDLVDVDSVHALIESIRGHHRDGCRVVFLMRFGHAGNPTARTGRLATEAILRTDRR